MTSKKQLQKRLSRRLQIEIDENIKETVKDLSTELGVSQSQLIQYFIICGVNNIDAAMKRLPRYLDPSQAPMWQY